MYTKITAFGLVLTLAAFSACKPTANNDEEAPVPAGMVRINLSKSGLPATIDIPDTTKKVYGIEALSSGAIHVFVGNGFQLLINLSGETISMKKNDIMNNDDLNKPKTWVVSDSNNLLYSTQKDTNAFANAKEEFHMYAIVKKGANTYYVEDLKQGADGNVYVFSQAQAQTMLNSAKSLTYVKPPAKDPS